MVKTYNPETGKFDLEVEEVKITDDNISESDLEGIDENEEDFISHNERPKKHRGWVATIWNVENTEEFYQGIVDKKVNGVTYIAYGLETTPKTGRLHHQAFFYTKIQRGTGKCSMKKLGSMWGAKHCYIRMMRGNFTQNRAYCAKDGLYTEVGIKPEMGKRLDLDDLKNEIMAGTTSVLDIRQDDPHMYHLYGRTLEKLQCDYNTNVSRTWTTNGYWLWGEPGCGKSHWAHINFSHETHYKYPDDGRWWDDYRGQEIVIFDDFRPEQVKFAHMLRLVDKYPMTVPRRGAAPIPFLAKHVIITCVRHPLRAYDDCDEDMRQLTRRFEITKVEFMKPVATPWLSSENVSEVLRG